MPPTSSYNLTGLFVFARWTNIAVSMQGGSDVIQCQERWGKFENVNCE